MPNLVYLEDLREHVTFTDKAICSLQAYALPARMLERNARPAKNRQG